MVVAMTRAWLLLVAGMFAFAFAPAAKASVVGVCANGLFLNEQRGVYTTDQVNGELSRMRASGITSARVDASWAQTERSPGQYDWTYNDHVAATLAAHGLRWMALIADAPGWATAYGTTTGPQDWNFNGTVKQITIHYPPAPEHYGDYAAFAAAFAARYHPASVEIWNEPDIMAYWWPRGTGAEPAQWLAMFQPAYAAVKAVSPGTRVLGPVVSPVGNWFLKAVTRLAPHLRTDGVSFHAYGPTVDYILGLLRTDSKLMGDLGLRVPMYASEYGWPMHYPGRHPSESLFAPMQHGLQEIPNLAESDWFTWMADGPDAFTATDDAAFTSAVRDSKVPWYAVPRLRGRTLTQARRVLRDFRVRVHRVKHRHGRRWRVVRSSLSAGAQFPAGTVINLWVRRMA